VPVFVSLTGRAGVTTRPAGHPSAGVPPAGERQLHLPLPLCMPHPTQVKSHLMRMNANERDFMMLMFRHEVDGPAAHQGAAADPSVLFIEVRAQP
jgi:hypothetical protein